MLLRSERWRRMLLLLLFPTVIWILVLDRKVSETRHFDKTFDETFRRDLCETCARLAPLLVVKKVQVLHFCRIELAINIQRSRVQNACARAQRMGAQYHH